MTGNKKTLSRPEEKNSPHKVSLGDDYQYPIKGIGEASYKLDSGTPMKMKEVLYVTFIDGKVLMWPKGKTIEDAIFIGEEGGLHKLKGHLETILVHEITSPS